MLTEGVVADLLLAADATTRVPTIKGNTKAEDMEVRTFRRQQPQEGIEAFHRAATIAHSTTIACKTAATVSSAAGTTEDWVPPSWMASPG